MTKALIGTDFKKLEKLGFKVFNFSNNRALRNGMKDFVDIFVVGHKRTFAIEIKIGKDKLSAGQEVTRRLFEQCDNYHLATENNYKNIINLIEWCAGERV